MTNSFSPSTFFVKLFFVISFFSTLDSITAQTGEHGQFDIAFYADVMTNASSPDHRLIAHQSFKSKIDQRLLSDNSFDDSFEDIPWIFTKYDKSKTFRLLSWQVEKENKEFEYQTIYQSKDGSFQYFDDQIAEIGLRESYSLEKSYAAIFHEIHSFNDYHIISGYRQLDAKLKQKICEVISFENGNLKLGKGIFVENENTPDGRGKKRIVLEYSAVANVNLNINTEEGIIVYDHIVPLPGRSAEEGMLQVPDGSYEAYEYKKGQWIYNEKLYTQIQSTPLNSSPKTIKRR